MGPDRTPYRIKYPEYPRLDQIDEIHGVKVPDPYRWLEDIDSPQTRQWIESQNYITFSYLEKIPARDKILQRIAELWNYEKYGVPFKRGNRYFFTRNDGLQNQNVLYWMESLDSEPQLLLDPNQLSKDGTIALVGLAISEDGRYMAYGLSSAGSDWTEWRVRDIDNAFDLPDHLKWIKFSSASWDIKGKGFYYSRYDEPQEGMALRDANYYHKLYYHQMGTSQLEDQLIYERPDQKEWGFSAEVTQDGKYLVISVWKGTLQQNGIFWQDLESKNKSVVEMLNQFDASYEFIGNEGPIFYFRTDLDAPKLRVIAIDSSNPDRGNWREIIPESSDSLQAVSLVGRYFVASNLHDAYSQIKIFDLKGNFLRDLPLPEIGSVIGFIGRQNDPETFYLFTGFTVPGTIYRYDIDTGESSIFRQPQVNFDPAMYVTEQVFYQSKDGTTIPMFLCYQKGMVRDGNNPTFLYGYGGFNIPLTPVFSVSNLIWMEMGGIYAQASLRGGGEYGKSWHEAGMRGQKQNVFDDFIASAEWLINHKYTNPEKLSIGGRSNGGLLVAACMVQRPELFAACLIGVGVLDMLRFHKFTIGWAWVSDYGSPDDPNDFKTLLAYSPYHNLQDGFTYPAVLITTADHDDRVYPAHSFKFTAALQDAIRDNQSSKSKPALIRIETRAGHGVGKPTSKIIEENADMWAFLVENLNIEWD
jgi:prolyl oligopeptidase